MVHKDAHTIRLHGIFEHLADVFKTIYWTTYILWRRQKRDTRRDPDDRGQRVNNTGCFSCVYHLVRFSACTHFGI